MNWKLTLVMLAILPVIAVMVTTASRKFRKQSKKIQVAMGDIQVAHLASVREQCSATRRPSIVGASSEMEKAASTQRSVGAN
mgnify:CR=1 FL=1